MSAGSRLYAFQYEWRQRLVGGAYGLRRRLLSSARARGDAQAETPARVLVVMTGLLGDTVMSTPLIVEARRLWPEARITLLGRRQNCELLGACPLVDELFEAPAIPFSLRKRRELQGLDAWLRSSRFDVALIALGDQFAAALARADIPVRVGVKGHALESCLTHTYSIGSAREWGPPERLNALRALGFKVEDATPRLWVADEARASVRRKLEELGITKGERYAVVHPFGSTPRQWWPLGRVFELAKMMRERHGLKTLVVGGPETRGALVDEGAAGAASESVVDGTGAFDVPELLAVVEGAVVVVTTDSGPFHIAGALSRPLVGLFRARRPEHAGRYKSARVVFGEDERCARVCEWDRCAAEPCRQMNALGVDEAAGAVDEMLGD